MIIPPLPAAFRSWKIWSLVILAVFAIILSFSTSKVSTTRPSTNLPESSRTDGALVETKSQGKTHLTRKSKTSKRLAGMLDRLKGLAPDIVDQNTVKRILLVTTFRSGSSFLGALLLQSDPLTYYHYEPLHFLAYDTHITEDQVGQAQRAVQQLFQCDMNEVYDLLRNTRLKIGPIYLKENKLLMTVCGLPYVMAGRCNLLPLLQETCQRSRVQLMKLTRLDLKYALTLPVPPDTKIVYLQRDPRGIYSSRKRRPWCRRKKCRNIDVLCKERESDIATLRNLTKHNIIEVRFEDLASNPMEESRKLFKKLGLPFSESVIKFIESHTKLPVNGTTTSAKVRDSKEVATSWKKYLTTDEIVGLQEKCATVFKQEGYELV